MGSGANSTEKSTSRPSGTLPTSKRLERIPVAIKLVAGLAILVVVGTLLLKLPGMTTLPITWIDAMFTATSAVTVTGLAVVTTSKDFTPLGQATLLLLIQIGGVGFLAMIGLGMILLGRRIAYRDRLALGSALGVGSQRGLVRMLRRTLVIMLTVEGLGALLLYTHWKLNHVVVEGAVWFYALFHAVSAFCNAGFDLFAGQTTYPAGLPTDPMTLILLGILILLGGLGAPIYMEILYEHRRRRGRGRGRRRFSLNARITMVVTVTLFLIGWIGLLASEHVLGGVLSEAEMIDRIVQTAFQSVSARTAGFPGFAGFDEMSQESRLLILALMFIGTAPASMGGGITTGTFSVLVLAAWSYSMGYPDLRVGKRTIAQAVVLRATVVLIVSLLVVVVATWLLLASHPVSMNEGLFEVISAFSTCGLSLGITGSLNTFGRLLIMAVMFWGRLGAVTVMIALVQRHQHHSVIDYPEETVLVG